MNSNGSRVYVYDIKGPIQTGLMNWRENELKDYELGRISEANGREDGYA